VRIEVCLDDVEGVATARSHGASSVELLSAFSQGGLTPSLGAVRRSLALAGGDLVVNVMVRPRPGDFVYDDTELGIMVEDIHALRELSGEGRGPLGVVFGALLPSGRVDARAVTLLREAAGEMPVTFHKAVDQTPDVIVATQTLVDAGVRRVLTSGGRTRLVDGAPLLARMVEVAGPTGTVVAAGLFDVDDDVTTLLSDAGIFDIHITAHAPVASRSVFTPHEMTFDVGSRLATSPSRLAAIGRLLSAPSRA